MSGMLRAIIALTFLLSSTFLPAAGEKRSDHPVVEYEVARTHERRSCGLW